MIVNEFAVTSIAAPTQIEGTLTNGSEFYLRFRNCIFYAEVDGKCIKRQYIPHIGDDVWNRDYMPTKSMFHLAGFTFYVEEE